MTPPCAPQGGDGSAQAALRLRASAPYDTPPIRSIVGLSAATSFVPSRRFSPGGPVSRRACAAPLLATSLAAQLAQSTAAAIRERENLCLAGEAIGAGRLD